MRRPACRSRATYSGQRKVRLRCLTPWTEAVTPAVLIILGIGRSFVRIRFASSRACRCIRRIEEQ